MLIEEKKENKQKNHSCTTAKPTHRRVKSKGTTLDEKIPRMMTLLISDGESESTTTKPKQQNNQKMKTQDMEKHARENVMDNPLLLFLYNGYSAFRIFETYLVTIDSLVGVIFTISTMLLCYYNAPEGSSEASMSWMILSITIVNPLSTTLGMSFLRREKAIRFVTNFRAYAFTIYLGHALFAWDPVQDVDIRWLKHSDEILSELVGIGDELCRFLTLPTCTMSKHRVTEVGRREAAMTMEVSYRLFNSLLVRRLVRLSMLAEKISEQVSLSAGDALRLRKVDRQFAVAIESLRMIKMYRTPLALRAFARLFALLLPPFYGPNLAKIALKTGSLPYAVCFAALTSLSLTTLYNAVQIMEDPFVAYITLDGIDCREELSVLHWHQLVNARQMVYPSAAPFPKHRMDEDGFNSNVKAVEGTVRCDSFILDESKREELDIRESAYAAMPMEGEDDNIIDITRSRFQSFEEKLRNRANTGISSRNIFTARKSATFEETMHQTPMPSSQSPLDNQEEFSNQQDMNAVKRRAVTDSFVRQASIFGLRSRFPDASDDADKSNPNVPDIEQQQSLPDYISEMRSRFYSNDTNSCFSNSLTRIRLESFDQNAFSDDIDIENPSDFPTNSPVSVIKKNDLDYAQQDIPEIRNSS